jgi:hypothetical protein
MKKQLFFLVLCLMMLGTLKAQNENRVKPPPPVVPGMEYNNYIRNDAMNVYKKKWRVWRDSLRCGTQDFINISEKDLEMMSGYGGNADPKQYLTGYFGFRSSKDVERMNIEIVFWSNETFKEDTARWGAWTRNHIPGERPYGFNISYPDLRSIYLLRKSNNIPTAFQAYFVFHSEGDKDSSRIAMVFRPLFGSDPQPEVQNSEIGPKNDRNNITGSSFINIDFTNPCPPCFYQRHDQ